MKESTLHQKLENIVSAGKPKNITHEGKTYYISKKKLDECEKEGGILPLLPLIFGGLSAAGAVAGGTAAAVKAANDKKAADKELAEQKRHNIEMEKKTGGHINNFVQALPLDDESKEVVEEFLENITDIIEIKKPDKEGDGLYLNPYSIVKAVNDKKAADEELAEQRRHNLEMKEHIKNFVQVLPIDDEAKQTLEEFFENSSDIFETKKSDKEGDGLYLNPYRR